jgi:3,4-dihydroxy 2-butanone 4-phosphate synthase / GTP cyclohydrolase II
VSSAVTPFASIEEAVEDIRTGKMVVVVDDPERENEGDLVAAAQFATAEAVNFMATHARGLICLCLTGERCEELGLPQMTQRNEARLGTAFTNSIEAREGVTTGISAADRAHTIEVAIDPRSTAHDSRSARATAAFSCAPARPRLPSTSPDSRGSSLPEWCARS